MADSQLNVTIQARDELSPDLNRLESKLIRFVGAVTSALAAIKISGLPISTAGDLERELANVKKTTGFTTTQILDLNDGLLKLSLHSDQSALNLAKISSAAGQQGLGGAGVAGVLKFTDSIARMASVLDIEVGKAGSDMGKLLNIFKIDINDVEKAASGFNEVTNHGAINAGNLLDAVKRIGAAAGSINATPLENLRDAITLGATGIELGLSPEVVGTSFTKILVQLKTKRADIIKALSRAEGKPVTEDEWLADVEKSGINAYLRLTKALRTFTGAGQAELISRTQGQGRIFGLGDKALQDVNDDLIRKNRANAAKGIDTGTSALREQQTVLNTFNAQVETLKNSLFKLAADGGQPLLAVLTKYVGQLALALQAPGMRAFIGAVVKSFGDMIDLAVSLTKAVSALGINWENFIKVVKVLLTVKAVSYFLNLATSLPIISGLLKKVTADTAAVGAAATGAGAAVGASNAKQMNSWEALRASVKKTADAYRTASAERIAAAEKEAAATAALAAKAAASFAEKDAAIVAAYQTKVAKSAAAASQKQSQPALNQARVSLNTAQGAVAAAITSGNAAIQNGDAALANATNTGQVGVDKAVAIGQAKRAAALKEHEAQMAAIEAEARGKRTAVDKEAKAFALAQEEAFYTKQLASLKVADAKRIQQAKVAADALLLTTTQRVEQEILAENAKLLAMQKGAAQANIANVIAIKNAEQLAKLRANAAAGILPIVPTTGPGLGGGPAPASPTPLPRAPAGGLFAGLSKLEVLAVGLTAVGNALKFVLRWLGPVYLGFIILGSIADALGWVDILPKALRNLGDWLGFSSEAARKEAQAMEESTAAMKRKNDRIKEQVDQYKELLLINGKLDKNKSDDVTNKIKLNTDAKTKAQGVDQLGALLSAARLVNTDALTEASAQPAVDAAKKNELDAFPAKIAKAKAELAQLQKSLQDSNTETAGFFATAVEKRTVELKTIEDAYAIASGHAKQLGLDSTNAVKAGVEDSSEALAVFVNKTTSIFTDASAIIFTQMVVPLIEARDARDKLLVDIAEQQKILDNPGASKQDKKEATERLAEYNEQLKAAKETFRLFGVAISDVSKKIAEMKGVPQNVLDSVALVLGIANTKEVTLASAKAIKTELATAKQQGTPLTGADAGKTLDKPKATGSNTVDPKGGESEARKLAKAKADLIRAQLEAEAAIKKQANDNALQEDQRRFDRGLIDLREFYREKARIDTNNLNIEINLKQDEIDNKLKERGDKSFKESDRVKIDKELAILRGQKAVLISRVNEIPAQTAETIRRAVKTFNEGVLADKLNLVKAFGLDDAEQAMKDQFTLIESQIEERIQTLETALSKKRPGITRGLIDGLKLDALVKAIDPLLQSIADRARLTADAVQNAFNRIAFLRNQGKVTDKQVEQFTNLANAEQAVAIQRQIDDTERLIAINNREIETKMLAAGATRENIRAAIEQDVAYQQNINALDGLKLKYQELTAVVDETATSINHALEAGISNSLTNAMSRSFGGIRRMLGNLLTDLGHAIRESVAKEFSQTIIKDVLGGGGTGGIGGFFSGLLRGAGDGPKALIDKDKLGRTKDSAMYVRLADAQDALVNPQGQGQDSAFGPTPNGETLSLKDFSKETQDAVGAAEDGATKILASAGNVFAERGLQGVVEQGIGSVKKSLVSGVLNLSNDTKGGGIFGDFFKAVGSTFKEALKGIGDLLGSALSGVGGILSGVFHTGGVVGEGSAMATVSPMVFANAIRYHTGGLAGLKPNEVPAILQKGEEVLTANSPRHRDNIAVAPKAPPVNLQLSVHPDALNMTLRDWFESELARIHANR
jgi:TP901 family phage tail tape measure protein